MKTAVPYIPKYSLWKQLEEENPEENQLSHFTWKMGVTTENAIIIHFTYFCFKCWQTKEITV